MVSDQQMVRKIICRYKDGPPVKRFLREGEDFLLIREIDRLTRELAEARDKALEGAADDIRRLATAMGRVAEHPEASQKKAQAAIDILEVAETVIRALKEKP